MNHIEQLTTIISEATSGIAFTGAGISTESGIPDFRSPGGVWSKNAPVMYDDFLTSRLERIRYWKMRREMYGDFKAAKPNAGHVAIAGLEAMGHLAGVVTQNIDGLHQDAGSTLVVELHGTNRMVACVSCGKEWEPDAVTARLDAGEDDPDCDECGSPIKSKTISFGQAMPVTEMQQAFQLSTKADVYLAIGSSLVVEPAASMPRHAKQHGATLVIINKTETPLDPMADLVIREGIGDTMSAVMKRLDPNWQPPRTAP